jgi:shikimate kinase
MNIVLIGYRGSGKSSLGKRLAAKLWLDFVDTDALITQRAGKTIREIFASQGEPAFRQMEADVIRELAAKDKQVIATGGGIVLNPANIAALKQNGKIIWLKATPKVLWERIQADTASADTRPDLLSGGGIGGGVGGIGGGLAEVEKILAEREPLYKAAADVSFEVTYLTLEDGVRRLAEVT